MKAAEAGHLEVLKWARENGCPWNGSNPVQGGDGSGAGAEVSARERLPMEPRRASSRRRPAISTLREVGARERLPVEHEATCAAAAEGGHLEVLKWARENGCRVGLRRRARRRRRAATSKC